MNHSGQDLVLTDLPGILAGVTCLTAGQSSPCQLCMGSEHGMLALTLQATSQDLSPGSRHQEVGCAPLCTLVPASLWLAGVCNPVRLHCACWPPVLLLCLTACCTAMLLMPVPHCVQVPVCAWRGADIAQSGAPSPAGHSS